MKILKELRDDVNSNADTLRKEIENIRKSQEKIRKLIGTDTNLTKGSKNQNE